MSLTYFTAGPSKLHPKIESFFKRGMEDNIGSISHRSDTFMKLYAELSTNLKTLLTIPQDYSVFYAGSATECMERIIQNCSHTETLHFVDGAFSKKFSEISKQHHRRNIEIHPQADHSFDLSSVPSDANPELVCLTHNETTVGTTLTEAFLQSVRERFPDALFALDIVSSVPVCDVDLSKIDCTFFSVQKGFGLPAGLGVLFVSPKALTKAEVLETKEHHYTGSFRSFASLAKSAAKNQTPETPNVFGMYLLNEVCKEYLSKGIDRLKAETGEKAGLLYAAVEQNAKLRAAIANIDLRSQTVLVIEPEGGSRAVIDALKEKGFMVSSGYGDMKDTQIRIANFPSHTKEEVLELCELLAGV